mmetsp:Transcript_74720/g.151745  ORF Transcript_74720/g.151745 Transcript_74720/m.151745 type:complete len:123 (-) Transcript_74720:41-409(-)
MQRTDCGCARASKLRSEAILLSLFHEKDPSPSTHKFTETVRIDIFTLQVAQKRVCKMFLVENGSFNGGGTEVRGQNDIHAKKGCWFKKKQKRTGTHKNIRNTHTHGITNGPLLDPCVMKFRN